MKIIYRNHIYEMASPLDIHKNIYWYHGTNSTHLESIMKNRVLKPSEIVTATSKRMMAPQYGKVYLTQDVEEALSYAYMRISSRDEGKILPILVVIDGRELIDFEPDEDILADLISKYVTSDKFNNTWLRKLAADNAPAMLSKYDVFGDYAYGTQLGKILIKYLTDDQKYDLINHGGKIAHTGEIKIKEIWQLPSEIEHVSILADEYYNVSKLLYSGHQL